MRRFVNLGHLPSSPRRDEVHVYAVDLTDESGPSAQATLSPAEGARALRYRFGRDRRRFVHSRVALRSLLAHYLGVDAAAVAIELDANGKPHVPGSPLGFNLSHAGDLALVAVGQSSGIGIDVEERVPRAHLRPLCGEVLSPAERPAFDALADSDLPGPFYALWTRKEAVLKALGTGLLRDPRSLDVGVEGPRLIDDGNGTGVEVATLEDDGTHVAALAVVGGFERVRLMRWPAAPESRAA